MQEIKVKEVVNKKMLKQFIMLPWTAKIYDNDPAWVPPIIADQKKLFDPKKGYFYEIGEVAYFLAYKDNKPVGRITAHINRLYEEKYNKDTGFFGFYEAIDDLYVAHALFSAAEEWLKKKGKTRVEGPQSFSVYDSVGFEVLGEHIMPVVGLFHFAPYYKNHVEACGYTKCIDWHCFLVRKIDDYKPYLQDVRENIMKKQDVKYVYYSPKEMKKRAKEIHEIFNKAWEGNWGHLPLTDKQFKMFVDELKQIAVPELIIFAEKDGKTVGFIVSIPDVNPALRILNGHLYPWRLIKAFREIKKVTKLRTIIMGVLPEYRGQKIDDVFYLYTIENGIRLGYTESDCSLIVETNYKMINALKPLKAECYKTYRIYEKNI
ncbi:MAG: GNAT family N-acetyltransferase [Spirochaetes bacterium]|nr:GNAT family N-acetyltransferase [Spirochaetota bacterium]